MNHATVDVKLRNTKCKIKFTISADRMVDLAIEVVNSPVAGSAADICAKDPIPFSSSETKVYPCPANLVGRFVTIFYDPNKAEYLQLCEVQVQGSKCLQTNSCQKLIL